MILSSFVGGVFLALLPFVRAFAIRESNETSDAPGLGLLILFGGLILVLLDLVALGFGIAGVVQRLRKRTFASLGIVISILVLALIYAQGIAWEPSTGPPGGTTIGLPSGATATPYGKNLPLDG